jgi:hypothetical protein
MLKGRRSHGSLLTGEAVDIVEKMTVPEPRLFEADLFRNNIRAIDDTLDSRID